MRRTWVPLLIVLLVAAPAAGAAERLVVRLDLDTAALLAIHAGTQKAVEVRVNVTAPCPSAAPETARITLRLAQASQGAAFEPTTRDPPAPAPFAGCGVVHTLVGVLAVSVPEGARVPSAGATALYANLSLTCPEACPDASSIGTAVRLVQLRAVAAPSPSVGPAAEVATPEPAFPLGLALGALGVALASAGGAVWVVRSLRPPPARPTLRGVVLERETAPGSWLARREGALVDLTRLDARAHKSPLAQPREARAIEHPNLPRVLAVERERGARWLVTEALDGPTPRAAEALRAARGALRALALLHSLGVAHGGVGPGAVRVEPDGTPKLVAPRGGPGDARADLRGVADLFHDCASAPLSPALGAWLATARADRFGSAHEMLDALERAAR